ncbi:MAG: right-handed parallel beta-helix repeat-containing protein, partial [Verrucomicrobiales bacterium]|nr:right-handed parallel beta-helix repeat-containing protein [Verrucomicrobiales bacterium]
MAPDAFAADYVVPRVAPVAAAAPTFHPPPPFPPGVQWVTTPTDDGPGSLRRAIANAAPGDTIRFAPTLPPFILLRSTLEIDKPLTILGPGPQKLLLIRHFGAHTPSFRIFEVRAANVTIAGLTIANGRAVNPDGQSDNLGGGIFNAGSLTVSNCVIAHNVALAEAGGNGFGGGIFTLGPLTLVDSTLRANCVNYAGGGLCTFHAEPVRIERCTISDNYAGVQGGGVNFQGRAGVLKNCTISGNATSGAGTASGLLHLTF